MKRFNYYFLATSAVFVIAGATGAFLAWRGAEVGARLAEDR